jgi:hypothetical protein
MHASPNAVLICLRFASLSLLLGVCGMFAAEPPALMREALEHFQIEGPKYWAFVQTTRAEGRSRVERFDPSQPELLRWSLVSEDGKTPSPAAADDYKQGKVRRSSSWNAPRLEKQIDPATCEIVESGAERLRCRFHLRQDDSSDNAAAHMAVVFSLHVPTRSIESVEIANTEPFSPSFGISIRSSRTVLRYSLPKGDVPSLLLHASLHIEGRAFWIKAISQTMEIVWSDHRFTGKKQP